MHNRLCGIVCVFATLFLLATAAAAGDVVSQTVMQNVLNGSGDVDATFVTDLNFTDTYSPTVNDPDSTRNIQFFASADVTLTGNFTSSPTGNKRLIDRDTSFPTNRDLFFLNTHQITFAGFGNKSGDAMKGSVNNPADGHSMVNNPSQGGAISTNQPLSFSGSGGVAFRDNQAVGGDDNKGGDITAAVSSNNAYPWVRVYARGGAVYSSSTSNMAFGGPTEFSRNTAKGGDRAKSGQVLSTTTYGSVDFSVGAYAEGGALYSTSSTTSFERSVIFDLNRAQAGNDATCDSPVTATGTVYAETNAYAHGGGAKLYITEFSGTGNVRFVDNSARGGENAVGGCGVSTTSGVLASVNVSAHGGGLYATSVDFARAAGTAVFSGNSATAGTGSGGVINSGSAASRANATATVFGGALYAASMTAANGMSLEFTGNTATGGHASLKQTAATADASAAGGAVYATGAVTLNGTGVYQFKNNTAKGGAASSAVAGTHTAYGLGGAIYTKSALVMNGGIFENNKAQSGTAELAGGFGGAVFFDGDPTAWGATTHSLHATAEQGFRFSGNSHEPGGGAKANSLYFGALRKCS